MHTSFSKYTCRFLAIIIDPRNEADLAYALHNIAKDFLSSRGTKLRGEGGMQSIVAAEGVAATCRCISISA